MNIAIDITTFDTGHGMRGVGIYTKNVIEALQQYDRKNLYTFITRKQKIPRNVDLVHYPYFDPFFLTLPILKVKPTVVTVHDVIPLLFPDKFPPGLRGTLKWQVQKQSLLGVKRVITVSECSKKDIITVTGYPKEHIDVIYSAPSPVYKSVSDDAKRETIKRKYKLPEKYVVYVGDVNWNKNIPSLINAFAQLTDKNSSLLLVGKAFMNKEIDEVIGIDSLIEKLHLHDRIIKPGYIPADDLCRIYQNAVCLVQPSYYEGFGFPVLEAMASGCPTVVADNSGLHEILGPSLTVNANDTESISFGIRTTMAYTQGKRKEIIQKGIKWANRFTWEKTVKNLLDTYERAVR